MHVHIVFSLKQDEDGYPPVATERVWAKKLADGTFEIDNIPFFVSAATCGDRVLVKKEGLDLWFKKTVQKSGNSLIRIVYFDGSDIEAIRKRLVAIGCNSELDATHHLIAVNIPPGVDPSTVIKTIEPDYSAGLIDYEEPILRA